jgi:predicted RNA-binding protein
MVPVPYLSSIISPLVDHPELSEREIEENLDQKHVADIKLTLEKETEHNKQLREECLMLKQQLVAERKKRMSLDDYIHDIGNQNEELLSKLHQRELYCIELEQTIRKAKGIKKEHRELHKINDTLNSKLLSSKEKLKHSRRERNELLFRLERLSNSLIAETQTQIIKSADEGESCMDLEDDVDNELFLDRQNRRLERMHNIMSLHG